MRKTLKQVRTELGVVSQGCVARTENTVLMHLAFRFTEQEAKEFILAAAEIGTSESLYARKAVLDKLALERS